MNIVRVDMRGSLDAGNSYLAALLTKRTNSPSLPPPRANNIVLAPQTYWLKMERTNFETKRKVSWLRGRLIMGWNLSY